MANAANFEKEMRAEQRRVVAQAAEAVRSIAQLLYSELAQDQLSVGGAWGSPVASGRFAGSMRIGIGHVDTSTAPADPNYRYPHGARSRAQIPPRTIRNQTAQSVAAKLRGWKLGQEINISNSVPYVRRIEIGGHSWQTPDGVFGVTVAHVLSQIRPALKARGIDVR